MAVSVALCNRLPGQGPLVAFSRRNCAGLGITCCLLLVWIWMRLWGSRTWRAGYLGLGWKPLGEGGGWMILSQRVPCWADWRAWKDDRDEPGTALLTALRNNRSSNSTSHFACFYSNIHSWVLKCSPEPPKSHGVTFSFGSAQIRTDRGVCVCSMRMQEWVGFHGKWGHSCAEEDVLHAKEEGQGNLEVWMWNLKQALKECSCPEHDRAQKD